MENKPNKITAVCIFLALFACLPDVAPAQVPAGTAGAGINEHLGDIVPLNAEFTDENGDTLRLRSIIKRPVIISLIYYRCPSICKPLLSGVAEVLRKIDMEPGEDYDVITISFDSSDRPGDSRRMKRNYLGSIGRPFPENSWRFLTGDSLNIARFTGAVGFEFKRTGEDFLHPASLVVLTGEGKIARYLYGITYLPFDLKMALTEASAGRTGPTIARVLLYCFSYDSEGKKYVANITRIAGAAILLAALVLISFLLVKSRTRAGTPKT